MVTMINYNKFIINSLKMQSHLLTIALIVVFMVSATSSMTITAVNKNNLEFSHDIVELVSGLLEVSLEGNIDSEDYTNNKLGAFLKVAGQTFPILQSMGITEKSLQFSEQFWFDWGNLKGCAGFRFEFYIGWFVTNGTAQDYQFLNVTYVPYVRGEGNVYGNLESWALKFSTNLGSTFVNIKVPISTQLNFNNAVQYCYVGNAFIVDPSILFTFETTVKSWEADLADTIYDPSHLDYYCNYGSPILVPIFNRTNPPSQYFNLVTRTCINIYTP